MLVPLLGKFKSSYRVMSALAGRLAKGEEIQIPGRYPIGIYDLRFCNLSKLVSQRIEYKPWSIICWVYTQPFER